MMYRDQIQNQTRLRASLLVCTRRCHTLIHTHKTSHARKHPHARTHARAHARTHTHTHTTTLFPITLCFPISATREMFKVPSSTALVPFLSSQRPFPVPFGYPQKKKKKKKKGLKRCSTGKKNSQILFSLASFS